MRKKKMGELFAVIQLWLLSMGNIQFQKSMIVCCGLRKKNKTGKEKKKMTLKEKLKAVINNFAAEQDWNIQEYAIRKRDIDYRRGKADAYRDVVHRLDEIIDKTAEPVGNSDKMTLTELAQKLLGIYDFKYLTVDIKNVRLWSRKPIFQPDPFGQQFGKWVADRNGIYNKKQCVVGKLSVDSMKCSLDLFEYEGEYGNTVFSKCIVEVKE